MTRCMSAQNQTGETHRYFATPRDRTMSHHAAEYFGAPMFGASGASPVPPLTARSWVDSISRRMVRMLLSMFFMSS